VIWKRNRPASLRPVRVGPNPRPEPGLILTIFIFARRTTRAPAFCSFLMTSFMLIVASTLCQLRHASHVGVEGRRHGGTGDIITSPALFDGLRLFRGSEKFRDDREVLVEMLRYLQGRARRAAGSIAGTDHAGGSRQRVPWFRSDVHDLPRGCARMCDGS
jgi:hypothetical protein